MLCFGIFLAFLVQNSGNNGDNACVEVKGTLAPGVIRKRVET